MSTNFNKRVATLKRHNFQRPLDDKKVRKLDIERRGLKRPNKTEAFVNSRFTKKKSRQDVEKVGSGEFNEGGTDSSSSEEEDLVEVVYREPTSYDHLLKRLGSQNESVANALRRRKREEEGESDTDEDVDDELESCIEAEEKDDDDDESPNDLEGSETYIGTKLSEDIGKDDDNDTVSDTDEESDSMVNDQSLAEASVNMRTFDKHLNHKLSSREVEDLLERKWSYTWKLPALNLKNCNWRGTGECSVKDLDINSYYGLKPKLYTHWLEIYKALGGSDFHQSKQKSFFSLCNSYFDIMHHNKKPFYLKGFEEDSSIMDACLMHSLNHIFRSRDLMIKNERKLAKDQKNVEAKSFEADTYLDRGFTRPKVLILLPLAGIARRVVKRLIELIPSKHKANVENIERFYEEFGSGIEDKDDEDDAENTRSKKSTKPSDFQALLGRDNDNDHFMIGVKFTNRGIKLYGDFYTSDLIVASPLGLITKIGEAEVEKEKDVDYLSSIEILIIDHADVMLMQNWSHVNTVVEQLNKIPSKQHGTDIMRIRPWYLDGQACFYRQTIILSSHLNPELNALFNQHCLNFQGKVKLECKHKGVLPKILTQVQQIYERFDAESIAEADDARLKYFSQKVFPKIKDSVQQGIMIFVSSYFEFVRLRNYLKSQSASFCLFGEYIKQNDISRVRGQFFRGEKRIMLYTERAHFYYRYKIRGVQNLIIYSLPERKEFYSEIVNLLEESADMNCTILFSRLDYFRVMFLSYRFGRIYIVNHLSLRPMIDVDMYIFFIFSSFYTFPPLSAFASVWVESLRTSFESFDIERWLRATPSLYILETNFTSLEISCE